MWALFVYFYIAIHLLRFSHAVSADPSNAPSFLPSLESSTNPTIVPTIMPTQPTVTPTAIPSALPSLATSNAPSFVPSVAPSHTLTTAPSDPSAFPTPAPSFTQTERPTNPTQVPTVGSSVLPSMSVAPSLSFSATPSVPTALSLAPTLRPSWGPTLRPSGPSAAPTRRPTTTPGPTERPSFAPSRHERPYSIFNFAVTISNAKSSLWQFNLDDNYEAREAVTKACASALGNISANTVEYVSYSVISSTWEYSSTAPTAAPSQLPSIAVSSTPSIAVSQQPSESPTTIPSAIPRVLLPVQSQELGDVEETLTLQQLKLQQQKQQQLELHMEASGDRSRRVIITTFTMQVTTKVTIPLNILVPTTGNDANITQIRSAIKALEALALTAVGDGSFSTVLQQISAELSSTVFTESFVDFAIVTTSPSVALAPSWRPTPAPTPNLFTTKMSYAIYLGVLVFLIFCVLAYFGRKWYIRKVRQAPSESESTKNMKRQQQEARDRVPYPAHGGFFFSSTAEYTVGGENGGGGDEDETHPF